MKIITVSNYGREDVAERLVAENIQSKGEAKTMLDALRATVGEGHPHWYEIRDDGHVLWRGMADLVGDET